MTNIFEGESRNSNLIKNEDVLNYDYVPSLLPFREGQVEEISNAIKPMFDERKGTNLFIYGSPGIGKSASIKLVLRELQEYSSEVIPLYVNCWKNRSKFFIFLEMANHLKIAFTSGKSAEHVLQQVEHRMKDKKGVFVFDEIDKAEDPDFLYQIIERFPKSTIILLSNSKEYTTQIDPRVRSRLMMRLLEFKQYSLNEITKILNERVKLSLKAEAIDPSIVKQIAAVTNSKGDLRVGLFILRESAKNAEDSSKKKIGEEDVKEVLNELESMSPFDTDKLSKDEEMVVNATRENNGKLAGELYDVYTKNGGHVTYRSFRRYIQRLCELGILSTKETSSGVKGKSTNIFINN